MYNQLYLYFDSICSKLQCSFHKGYNAKHCLMFMIGKWRRSLDEGAYKNFPDFSKAFECYNHNLLIAKLTAYRVDIKFLPQKQKTKYES